MSFRYFHAPESEMAGLLDGTHTCGLCGVTARCFNLQRALGSKRLLPATRGCMTCLQNGRFGFFHVTEVGYLDENGLTWYGEPPMTPARVFIASAAGVQAQPCTPEPVAVSPPSEEAIEELRRTPQFSTWNEVSWPVHCRDFMTFLGSWQPTDVAKHADLEKMSSRDFFNTMVEPEERDLWRQTEEWGMNFLAFRCTACRQYRGIIDLD